MQRSFYLCVNPNFMHKKIYIRDVELTELPEQSLRICVFLKIYPFGCL